MNYPGLKPWVSQVEDLRCLRFAPGGHSSPSLKARGFLAVFINQNPASESPSGVFKFLSYLSALRVLCGEKNLYSFKGTASSINMMGMSSSMR
jgi:hypothetical protein